MKPQFNIYQAATYIAFFALILGAVYINQSFYPLWALSALFWMQGDNTFFSFTYKNNTDQLAELEKERLKWSLETFEATPLGSLRKLESEIAEIEVDLIEGHRNPVEFADALMCLFDCAGRNGISVEEITKAFAEKLEVNKKRKWVKNADSSYSHVK